MRSKDILEHISFVHPLHPFNPKYFRDKKFFSFSKNNMLTAQAMVGNRLGQEPFLRQIPLPKNGWQEIDIKELWDFFSHPCKFLLRKRLGITLPADEDLLKDREILRLKGLDKYRFEQELLDYKLHETDRERIVESMQAKGLLPLGSVGEYEFRKTEQRVETFLRKVDGYTAMEKKELDVELIMHDFLIRAKIKDIYHDRLFFYRLGRIRPSDRIRIWLNSLLLILYGFPLKEARFMGLDDKERLFTLKFTPIDRNQAKDIFNDILYIFQDGLQRPIHFFPESSWKYSESIYVRKENGDRAIQKARDVWEGNEYRPGEGKDDYYQFCFRGIDPIDEEFIGLSKRIFLPIILNSQREE